MKLTPKLSTVLMARLGNLTSTIGSTEVLLSQGPIVLFQNSLSCA